ncbi:MAG: surface-adhesin E family protein [Thermodesulfovibrionales bacterium]
MSWGLSAVHLRLNTFFHYLDYNSAKCYKTVMVRTAVLFKPTMGFIKPMLLLMALLFPLELTAATADWIELTKDASGTAIYYIDGNSIHYEGYRVTFWDERKVSDDPKFKEMMGYNEVDCKNVMYRTLWITGFDKDGKSYNDSNEGQWQHIEPNTAMVAFYRFVCKE